MKCRKGGKDADALEAKFIALSKQRLDIFMKTRLVKMAFQRSLFTSGLSRTNVHNNRIACVRQLSKSICNLGYIKSLVDISSS